MKTILAVVCFLLTSSVLADQSVRGYMRKDGTYVQPHQRSSPDSYRWNNYGSQGNTNPYTGQRGYDRNELSSQPTYNDSRPSYKNLLGND